MGTTMGVKKGILTFSKVFEKNQRITGCQTGTFGRNCNRTCSSNCRITSICKKDTGHCINGCTAGWKGDFCNEGTYILKICLCIYGYLPFGNL